MPLLTSVLSYAGAGFLARCYALGIQKRNVFENLGGHAALMTAFGAAGYYFHGVKIRQADLIEQKKQEIKDNRERLSERLEKKFGGNAEGEEES